MNLDVVSVISSTKMIAVIRGYYKEVALNVAKALSDGGVCAIECAFDASHPETHKDTQETINLIKNELGSKMIIGAGTVTSKELVSLAKEAGASFIVSPDMNPEVIQETKRLGLISAPGAFTPTEIQAAYRNGADFVKVFPCSVVGPAYIKAVLQPLSQVRLLAFGGINPDNAKSYLDAGCVGIGVGSFLFNKEWVANCEWEKITTYTKEFIDSLK